MLLASGSTSTEHIRQEHARNVLLLSWEYPPRIIGGISTHVYHLSRSLATQGVSVHVITCSFPGAPSEETVDGVRVTRVENSKLLQANFLLWIYHLNSQMKIGLEKLAILDRKSTRLNSSHLGISYAVFCLKKKK